MGDPPAGDYPTTLLEFERQFGTDEACRPTLKVAEPPEAPTLSKYADFRAAEASGA